MDLTATTSITEKMASMLTTDTTSITEKTACMVTMAIMDITMATTTVITMVTKTPAKILLSRLQKWQ